MKPTAREAWPSIPRLETGSDFVLGGRPAFAGLQGSDQGEACRRHLLNPIRYKTQCRKGEDGFLHFVLSM
jgi:hypothetical protein